MRFARVFLASLLLVIFSSLLAAPGSAQFDRRRAFLRSHYRAADGTWVMRPHHYKVGPRAQVPTATCRDGSLSFAHSRSGQCAYHGGIAR